MHSPEIDDEPKKSAGDRSVPVALFFSEGSLSLSVQLPDFAVSRIASR